jgi:uncharacterized Zn-finger protein
MDFNLQHISHVFGNKQEKKLKKTEDDEEDDHHFLQLKYDDHRPLTPISSLSSSPPNILLLEKKIFSNDIPPTPAMTIRSRDRYCCSYCSKTFPRSANLTRHLRTHTDKYLVQTLVASSDGATDESEELIFPRRLKYLEESTD